MDFSTYPQFEATFQRKFGALFLRYPHASMIIEKQLRLVEADELSGARSNMEKLARPRPGRRARALITAHLLRKPNAAPHGFCYLKLQRFGRLTARIEDYLHIRDMATLPANETWLMPRQRALDVLAMSGPALRRFMSLALRSGIDTAIKDGDLMQALEREAERDGQRITALLKKWDIRLIIADGDTLPSLRLIGAAARKLGRPFIAFAHGYVQNPKLVSLAPINADYLITWTEQQAEDIRAVLPLPQRAKVLCFGYPKDVIRQSSATKTLLIIWHPTRDGDLHAQVAEMRKIIDLYASEGFRTRVRFHPKEDQQPQFLRALGRPIDVSREPLAAAIETASTVVGSRSSVLVEAALSGVPTYQLQSYARETPIEFTRPLSLDEQSFSAPTVADDLLNAPLFDEKAFASFLDELLGRHPG
jgi:hypothetical protein